MLVNCLFCHKEFNKKPSQVKVSPNHYCSASCAAKANNSKYPKRLLEGHCKNCNNTISTKNKYCSDCRSCRKKEIMLSIKSSVLRKPLESLVSRNSIKNRLFETQEKCCESCGLHTWMDSLIMLELHHIDGNGRNNVRENLQILCPNCHSMTDNWRNKKRK